MASDPFRGLRREIAIALRDGQRRTLYEISRAVARRPGDIQRTVRQMHAEELLHADNEEPVRGTQFWFNDDFAEAFEASLADSRPAGQMTSEQRMLEVVSPEGTDLYGVLGRPALNGTISWAVEWGGDGEWLIGLLPDAGMAAAERLVRVLRSAGIRCRQRRVGAILSGEEMRQLIVSAEYTDEVSVR